MEATVPGSPADFGGGKRFWVGASLVDWWWFDGGFVVVGWWICGAWMVDFWWLDGGCWCDFWCLLIDLMGNLMGLVYNHECMDGYITTNQVVAYP